MFGIRQESTIENKDIKGLHLKKVRSDDKVGLKLIYLLDPKYNSGFLILSEKYIPLQQILDWQSDIMNSEVQEISMEQKQKSAG